MWLLCKGLDLVVTLIHDSNNFSQDIYYCHVMTCSLFRC